MIQDECTEDLSSDSRAHIAAMEISLENLQIDISQYQCESDSLSSSIGNLTRQLNEKTKELKEAEGRIADLTYEIEKSKRIEKELRVDTKNLEQQIDVLSTEKAILEQNSLERNEKFDVNCKGIGEQFGMDVKKSFSDSNMQIKNNNLLEENRSLKKELEKLRSMEHKQNDTELVMMRVDSGELRANLPLTTDNIDSGICFSSQKNSPTKKHLDQLETQKCEVKSGFHNLEEKYSTLDRKLTDLSSMLKSSSLFDNMDNIANLVSVTNNSTSKDWSGELEQLKFDLMENVFTVQDEVHKGHLETREEINTAVNRVIESIFQNGRKAIDMSEERIKYVSARRKGKTTYSDKENNSNHIFHSGGSQNNLSELETIKERIGSVQHSISQEANEKRRIENQRDKIEEELLKMVETLKRKEEEMGKFSQLYEEEKRKVHENDSCFRSEMEELRREQLEIYEEFRQMCETLKRKDIELSNRNKQIKLINAEGREKEDELNSKVAILESDKVQVENERVEVTKQYHEKCCEIDSLTKRFVRAEEQLRTICNNLSRVDDIFLKAKSQGLYK